MALNLFRKRTYTRGPIGADRDPNSNEVYYLDQRLEADRQRGPTSMLIHTGSFTKVIDSGGISQIAWSQEFWCLQTRYGVVGLAKSVIGSVERYAR